jgi:catechol 2,3-dioxygenase-like lactoylglutathione lyase family enzyme
MSPITGIDHVQIAAPAGCEDDARHFFGELLGLPELEKPPLLAARGGCWFQAGTHELHIGVADPFIPAAKAHPAFRLDTEAQLHALAARLQAAGITVTWADPAEIQGAERFHAADPWGNRLEFVAPAG